MGMVKVIGIVLILMKLIGLKNILVINTGLIYIKVKDCGLEVIVLLKKQALILKKLLRKKMIL
jgi:hypothetical protein